MKHTKKELEEVNKSLGSFNLFCSTLSEKEKEMIQKTLNQCNGFVISTNEKEYKYFLKEDYDRKVYSTNTFTLHLNSTKNILVLGNQEKCNVCEEVYEYLVDVNDKCKTCQKCVEFFMMQGKNKVIKDFRYCYSFNSFCKCISCKFVKCIRLGFGVVFNETVFPVKCILNKTQKHNVSHFKKCGLSPKHTLPLSVSSATKGNNIKRINFNKFAKFESKCFSFKNNKQLCKSFPVNTFRKTKDSLNDILLKFNLDVPLLHQIYSSRKRICSLCNAEIISTLKNPFMSDRNSCNKSILCSMCRLNKQSISAISKEN